MGRAKLVDTEKARAIAIIEQGVPVTQVAADLKISRQAIYNLIKAARSLPKGAIPRRRQGTGGKRKTSRRTDALLKRQVLANPMLTAASIKNIQFQFALFSIDFKKTLAFNVGAQ